MPFSDTAPTRERVLLLSVDTNEYDNEASVEELRALVRTAGGEVEGVIVQKLPAVNPVSYIGSGKLAEAELFCHNQSVDLVICDCTLTAVQQRVLKETLKTRVIDRTLLILDIFAAGAKTAEGKLQVELAQMKYFFANLTGLGEGYSRLGGGIGTRGPGESKLETDRRHFRRRIDALERQLKALDKRRTLQRERRKKDGFVTCAIVGYTNAGKSTLLNTLTDAGVLAEDKLFATLDPTARALKLPDGRQIMLVDTVGFLSRLPHLLIDAFKSTLEEAVSADLLLLLCDASDPECEEKLETSRELLKELGAQHKPVITVYNKCDIAPGAYLMPAARGTVMISAATGMGLGALLDEIARNLPEQTATVRVVLPYKETALAAWLHENAQVDDMRYEENGIHVTATLPKSALYRFLPYLEEQ